MATKRYVSKTGVKYTFLVDVNGTLKSISFKGNEKDCIISDPATQKAVESHPCFKTGKIGVAPGTTAGGFDEEVGGLAGGEKTGNALTSTGGKTGGGNEKKIYEKVVDFQAAKDILRGEPYNIAHQSLGKPQHILAKAEEVGISFPNLKLEE